MSTTISSVTSTITIQALQTNAGGFSTSFTGNLNRSYSNSFTGVTFANLYFATRSAAAAVDALNLHGGLTDYFNQTLTFATLRYVLISNNDSTNSLTIFGGTTPVIPNSITLPAGDTIALECNYTVTNPTAININVDPGANTVSYDVVLLGT